MRGNGMNGLLNAVFVMAVLIALSKFVLAQDGPPPPPPPAPVVTVSQWKPFVVEKAGFSVLLPKVPTETTQTAEGQSVFMYRTFLSQHNFTVVCIDLSSGVADPKKVYEGAVNGIKKSDKFKVVSENPFKLGQYDGLEVTAEVEAGMFGLIQSRFLVTENRFYQLAVIAVGKKVETEESRAFLDSFKLTFADEKKPQPNTSKPNNE